MKKAQVHMIETITVLVVFFIIFFIGIYIYYDYTYKNIEEASEIFKESEYTTLLYSIASKPEFSCPLQKGNCIDISKLEALKQLKYSLFRKKIIVKVIYPEVSEPDVWEFPSKFTSNEYQNYELPISLYYPSKDEFKIGKLTLTIFQ